MSLKKNPLQLFALVFVLILVFGVVGSVLLRNYKEQKNPEKFLEKEILINETHEAFPQILNEPVRNVTLGSLFTFSPRIVPIDEKVNLSLLSGPEWLALENSEVVGTPTTLGSFSFILRLEKDGEYIDEEFFLIVTDASDE